MMYKKYNEQLLPCPVCGSKAEIHTSRSEDCLYTGVRCVNQECNLSLDAFEHPWTYRPDIAVSEWNSNVKDWPETSDIFNVPVNVDEYNDYIDRLMEDVGECLEE